MMIRPMRVLLPLLLVLALALAWSCKKSEDGGTVGVPAGAGLPTSEPRLGSADNEILADGEDVIEIVARITDQSGRPLIRVPVIFRVESGVGSIADPNAVTDFNGRASVVLSSIASPVNVTSRVCASIPDEVDSSAAFFKDGNREPLQFPVETPVIEMEAAKAGALREGNAASAANAAYPALSPTDKTGCVTVTMLGIEVVLSAAKSQIPADGVRTTEVTAFIRQTVSGIPIPNKRVRFSTTDGRIDSEFTTDSNGEVEAILRSSTTPGGAVITAFLGAGLEETIDVEFTPITFLLGVDTPALAADGVSQARVVATALSQDRNPLAGLSIEFATRLGTITSPIVTDGSGRAVATLVGDGRAGVDTVFARFGGATVGTVVVVLTETFKPQRVVASASPASILADGLSQSAILAAVFDSLGGPVPDGTVVAFAIVSGGGSLASSATTEGGVARATLTSPTVTGTAVVRASVGGVSATTSVAFTPNVPAGLQVTANPTSLVGNEIETSMIVATVRDLNGNLVGPGVSVTFSADRGRITASSLTNDASQAMAVYTSALGAGPVKINVTSGGTQGFVNLTLTSGDPSQIVLINDPPFSIGVARDGQPQSATMIFQVRSADGVPIGAANPVTVQFTLDAKTNNGLGSGEFLQPASDVTDENGVVRTTLNSGSKAGTTRTVARITIAGTPPRVIESRVIPINIDADLPVVRNLTVASQLLNIEGLCYFNIRTRITALVYDQFQNPVPEGTVVYFTSRYAGIQAADTTDDHGLADVDLISANELPPTTLTTGTFGFPNGFVQVYSQTADSGGAQIRDSTYVLFSGCSILENVSPSSFTIADAGCQNFTFNLWDLNHNPLTAGTKISVSTTAGTLGGDTDFTLPDTQFGFTLFSFTLCDADPGDTDPAVGATVTIKITSKNGNVSTSISGTIN